MKEILLCKYGEIVLKGLNKSQFESVMMKEIRRRVEKCGGGKVTKAQSTVYIDPTDTADIEMMIEELQKVFGIASICRAAVVEKNMDAIIEAAKEYLPDKLSGFKTFRADAKRADKRFPLKSPEIAAQVGGAVLSTVRGIKVSLNEPDVTVMVEVREEFAYIHAGAYKGAGGMPVGTAGRALLLLSGGIDSPVAGYMMAKRGARVEAVHFESFPYTSEAAREKVLELARLISDYCGPVKVHVVSVTEIQEPPRHRRRGVFHYPPSPLHDETCRSRCGDERVPRADHRREPRSGSKPDHDGYGSYRSRRRYAHLPSLHRYG